MKIPNQSKLGSILFSTACLVAFGLLADPVIKPDTGISSGIEVRPVAHADRLAAELRVGAGKSLIVESSARIVRAAVENPDLAGAVTIDDHELLLNAKAAGRTNITVWREDGQTRQFDLHIDSEPPQPVALVTGKRLNDDRRGLTAAYQDAMARVQTAITGVDR